MFKSLPSSTLRLALPATAGKSRRSARRGLSAVAILAWAACTTAQAAPTPVASYAFNGSLASSVAGAPALVPTDPLNRSGFMTDTVNGTSRTVYNFQGAATPLTNQAGLTLDTTGLLSSNSTYSLEIVFKFTDRNNAWRRIVDVSSRSTDAGFYVDPSNRLDVYPIGGGSAFSNDVYHDVFLVDNAGSVSFYLDGSAQATFATTVMNIDSTDNINLFLDNLVGGGQGEYSSGSIASLRLYNEALDAVPPPDVTPLPAVPEPETYALMLAGLALLGGVVRRTRA